MAKHKCAECGFLVVRDKTTNELVSPAVEYRDIVRLTQAGNDPSTLTFDPTPICSAGACNLWPFGKITTLGGIIGVLTQNRDCLKFTVWLPALSPKEHLDMLNIQAERLWHERQAERDRQWRKEDRRHTAIWGICGIVLGVALTTLTQRFINTPNSRPTIAPAIPAATAPPSPAQQP